MPAVMSLSDKAPLLIAAILEAVLESKTVNVTRTPRGRRSSGNQAPLELNTGVPVAEFWSP